MFYEAAQVRRLKIAMERSTGAEFSAYGGTSTSTAVNGIPAGGTIGQVLTKDSNVDYDVSWQTSTAGTTRYASIAKFGTY